MFNAIIEIIKKQKNYTKSYMQYALGQSLNKEFPTYYEFIFTYQVPRPTL